MGGALQACIQGSVMIAVVLVARRALDGHAPRWVLPVLWYAVLARLCLPLELPSLRFEVVLEPGPAVDLATPLQTRPAPQPIPEEPLSLFSVPWAAVWCVGAAVCLLVLACRYHSRNRSLRTCPNVVGDTAREWLASHQLARHLRIVESDTARVPATCGFVQPLIVVPSGYADLPNRRALLAMEHEYAHVRRFDAALRGLFLAVACVYWFDPLVWVAYCALARDQELACDEAALARLGDSARGAYAEALLDAAAKTPRSPSCETGLGGSPLEQRITAIVRPSPRVARPFVVAAIAAALALSFAAATCATATKEQRVELGTASFALPSSWLGRVEVVRTSTGVGVSVAGNPYVVLLELVDAESRDPARVLVDSHRPVWSATAPDGVTYELWGTCYAEMAMRDSWHQAPFSNPSYPGESVEREAIGLCTGWAVTAEDAHASSEMDPSWFDFYLNEVVPTARVS